MTIDKSKSDKSFNFFPIENSKSDPPAEKNDLEHESVDILKEENNKLKQELVEANDKIKTLESEFNEYAKSNQILESENLKKSEEIQSLYNELNKLKQQISEMPPINPPGKEMTILDDETIENLETLEKIGKGKLSEVFKVAKKEIYALKVMDITNLKHENFQQLISEYEIMHILHHPNTLKVYGIFLSNSSKPPSILLEYCPKTLEKAISFIFECTNR